MIRLAVRCAPEYAEHVMANLLELAPNGLEEERGPGWVEFAIYGPPGEVPDLGEVQAAAGGSLVDVTTTSVPDDWADRWADFHRPIEVGGRIGVRPSWWERQDGLIDVVVDPGRAFGTGGHPTTRLSLALLIELEEAGEAKGPLADWGTGSGVLGSAAGAADRGRQPDGGPAQGLCPASCRRGRGPRHPRLLGDARERGRGRCRGLLLGRPERVRAASRGRVGGSPAPARDLMPPDPSPELPIAMFDSGVGGLTVLHECLVSLPEEDYVYLGDDARFPYGARATGELREHVEQVSRFLLERGAKLLVIACNSAASAGQEAAREIAAEAGIEVVAVIQPEAEIAAAITDSGKVGVLATPATVRSGAYVRALSDQQRALTVTEVEAPD